MPHGPIPARRAGPHVPDTPLALHPTRRTATSGRHELGQNHLVDDAVIRSIVQAVPQRPRLPILELGCGDGALTSVLADAGHAVTAVDIDPRRASALRRRRLDVAVVEADMLAVHARTPHHLVSNVPFGITTALLRHVLAQESWQSAVLLLQWEVARKRAGVGGATLLTVQWWPWVGAALGRRVPARAFRPVPSVDAGVLVLTRRDRPLLPEQDRPAYQAMARRVFAEGSVGAALVRAAGREAAAAWLRDHGLPRRAAPRTLAPGQWVALYETWRRVGAPPGRPEPRPRAARPASRPSRSRRR